MVGVEGSQPATTTQHYAASPRRSLSLSPADALASGWRRPWMSQVHTQMDFLQKNNLIITHKEIIASIICLKVSHYIVYCRKILKVKSE